MKILIMITNKDKIKKLFLIFWLCFLPVSLYAATENTKLWDMMIGSDYRLSDSVRSQIDSDVASLVQATGPFYENDLPFNGVDSVIDGNYMYVAAQTDGVHIVDVSDAANPIVVTTIPIVSATMPNIDFVALKGTMLYTLGNRPGYISGTSSGYHEGHLNSFDISDPLNPIHVTYVSHSGNLGLEVPQDMKIEGDHLFVTSYFNTRFTSYDISDPTAITFSDALTHTSDNGTTLFNRALKIALYGNYAYVTTESYVSGESYRGGIAVVDISDPQDMSIVRIVVDSSTLDINRVKNLGIHNNHLYVITEGSKKLVIFDITNPALPIFVSEFADTTTSLLQLGRSLQFIGDRLYLGNANVSEGIGINVFDISLPSTPSLINTLTFPGYTGNFYAQGMVYFDNYIYFLSSISARVEISPYTPSRPHVKNDQAETFETQVLTFTETKGSLNEGDTAYQVSSDGGVTWKYWNGLTWAVTTETNGSETSSAGDVHDNITTLDVDGGQFVWRAYLISDGTQKVEIDSIVATFRVNEAPTDILISGSSVGMIDENNSIGDAIGVLSTSDLNAIDTHVYTLGCDIAGIDDTFFTIDGMTLRASAVFDFESAQDNDADSIYEVCVRSTDNGYGSYTVDKNLTITIIDTNEAPVFDSPVSVSVDENEFIATTIISHDEDMAQTISYAIVNGGDGALFSLNASGQLSFVNAPDFESPLDTGGIAQDNIYYVNIAISDDGVPVQTTQQTVTVTVIDKDDVAPVIAEVVPVPLQTSDTTPQYKFSSSKPGVITYGGACSSPTVQAHSGINVINFEELQEGIYNDCSISVVDESGNQSMALIVSPFIIAADTSPTEQDSDGDGISDREEDESAPGGDGNGDGIPDRDQSNVTTTIYGVEDVPVTLSITGACDDIQRYSVVGEADIPLQDLGYVYNQGLNDFVAGCDVVGGEGIVIVYYDDLYDTRDWRVRKFDGIDIQYRDISQYVTYGTARVDGKDVTTMQYMIKDGGALDADHSVNGVIVDPAGPATPLSVKDDDKSDDLVEIKKVKNLFVECSDEGSAKLTWKDKSQGEEGYKIYRKKEGGSYKKIGKTKKGKLKYTDEDELAPGEEYTWRVYTYHGDQESDASKSVSCHIPEASLVQRIFEKVLTEEKQDPLKTEEEIYQDIAQKRYVTTDTGERIPLWSTSSETGRIIAYADAGDEVVLIGISADGQWYRITDTSGREGWIRKKDTQKSSLKEDRDDHPEEVTIDKSKGDAVDSNSNSDYIAGVESQNVLQGGSQSYEECTNLRWVMSALAFIIFLFCIVILRAFSVIIFASAIGVAGVAILGICAITVVYASVFMICMIIASFIYHVVMKP